MSTENIQSSRVSFIFYESFYDSISKLKSTDRLIIFDAISQYALYAIEPELSGITEAIWKLIKPQLDANWRRYKNGCKGGSPKQPQDYPQDYPQDQTKNQPKAKPTPTQKSTKAQANDNDNDNEKDKDKDNKKENKNRNKNVNINAKIEPDTQPHTISESLFIWLKTNAPTILEFQEPLTAQQEQEIMKKHPNREDITSILMQMHNNNTYLTKRSAKATFDLYAKNAYSTKSTGSKGKEYSYESVLNLVDKGLSMDDFRRLSSGKWVRCNASQ